MNQPLSILFGFNGLVNCSEEYLLSTVNIMMLILPGVTLKGAGAKTMKPIPRTHKTSPSLIFGESQAFLATDLTRLE